MADIVFTPKTWVNLPAQTTPISAAELNRHESVIALLVSAVNTLVSASPSSGVAHLATDETFTGIKTFSVSPVVPANAFTQDRIAGLIAALGLKGTLSGGFQPVSELAPGSVLRVKKSGSTWGPRPTTRTDITVIWVGADPSPATVTSGTGGMYVDDERSIPAP